MSARVALITGATDGIGRAAARSLARDDWEVVIVGRSPARCEAAVSEIAAAVPGARVSSLAADLSRMADVQRACRQFSASHDRLDLLLLNANAVTQEHRLTDEGFEANMAIGHFGRALMARALEPLLSRTPDAQVLSVVGLNLTRFDIDDHASAAGFSSMKALGRWQWAQQVYLRAWNRRGLTRANVYMPGLVKTKILANEPQPMRSIVRLFGWLMGVPVERAGEEVVTVVRDVVAAKRRDAYYARTKHKGVRELRQEPDDDARVWASTERALSRWATPPVA